MVRRGIGHEWGSKVIINEVLMVCVQKAGHYMDSIAAGVDAALEEEELLADQLKEYLFSAESLQNVCKHHELLQLDYERAQDAVAARNAELNRVQQGKPNFITWVYLDSIFIDLRSREEGTSLVE